jgi:hypothetical protein
MRKAMKKVRKTIASRQMNDVLNMRNDSSTILIHDLSLNSLVLMYRDRNVDQSQSWKDSYKSLSIENESAVIETTSESTKFRATFIKSYHENDIDSNSIKSLFTFNESSQSFIEFARSFIESQSIISQSDDVSIDQESTKRDRDRLRKYFTLTAYLSFIFNNDSIDSNLVIVLALVLTFVAKFETNHTSLSQFAAFRQKETIELIEKMFFNQ